MAAAIPEIDTSVLDDLGSIRHEQAQLVQFRSRAEDMKPRVDARVYERVVSDYQHRETALLERAAPLEARARVEYRKLRARHGEITETRRAAEFDKAEVEFRHSVGEITDEELAERIAAPEAVLASCQQELEALDALKARFTAAYEGVEEEAEPPALEPSEVDAHAAQPPAAEPPVPDASAVDAHAAEPPVSGPPSPAEDLPAADEPPAEAPAEPPEAVAVHVDETVAALRPDTMGEAEAALASAPSSDSVLDTTPPPDLAPELGADAGPAAEHEPPPLPPSLHQAPTQMYQVPPELMAVPHGEEDEDRGPEPDAEHGENDTDSDVTFILPDAILVDAARGATEFRLGAMNYIGRADDNQIRLKSGDISRRHAMIALAQGNFLLRDLQSQNGTYVNGQRVAEHVLADGDRVRIGNSIELVFHYASSSRRDSGHDIEVAAPGS